MIFLKFEARQYCHTQPASCAGAVIVRVQQIFYQNLLIILYKLSYINCATAQKEVGMPLLPESPQEPWNHYFPLIPCHKPSAHPFEIEDCMEWQIPRVPLKDLPVGLISDEI